MKCAAATKMLQVLLKMINVSKALCFYLRCCGEHDMCVCVLSELFISCKLYCNSGRDAFVPPYKSSNGQTSDRASVLNL